MRFSPGLRQTEMGSLVVIAGYRMAIFANAALNICLIMLILMDRTRIGAIPLWLMMANFLFLIAEIIFLFK
ncbi:MAG TPA: hypothetical protein VKR32_18000 [Puia sp.]|nr:hypothetical protein [Puia sp.]